MAIPLIGHGNVLGVPLDGVLEPHAFEPDERAFLLSVADQCAQALERSQLLDAERAQREAAQRAGGRVARLQAVTAALSRASTAEEVAAVLVTEAMGALGGSSCAVFMLHAAAGRPSPRCRCGNGEHRPRPPRYAAGRRAHPGRSRGAPRRAAVARDPGAARRELSGAAPLRAPPERMGALAALPLKIGECVLGAVTFGFDAARAFSPEKREP